MNFFRQAGFDLGGDLLPVNQHQEKCSKQKESPERDVQGKSLSSTILRTRVGISSSVPVPSTSTTLGNLSAICSSTSKFASIAARASKSSRLSVPRRLRSSIRRRHSSTGRVSTTLRLGQG